MYKAVTGKYYRLLHPRPAYIIAAGRINRRIGVLAASWVTPVSEDPPRVAVMWEKESHGLSVAREVGCFTINIIGESLLDKLWYVGTVSGWDVRDKAEKSGLRFRESPAGCVYVDGSYGYIDSRIYKIIDDVADDVDIVIGDVVGAYYFEGLFDERRGWQVYKARIPLQVAGRAFTVPGRIIYARKSGG